MKFGENLKRVRKMRKISQENLAERLGVSRQSVSKWETGENYPSMTNIMCLCTIFKCNINELVHENLDDINSFDEEVKMSVVKFKEEKQKKVKTLSKIIEVVSKIGEICCYVGIALVGLLMIAMPVVLSNVEVKDNEIIFAKESVFKLEEKNGKLIIKVGEAIIADESDPVTVAQIKDALEKNKDHKLLNIGYMEVCLASVIATMVIAAFFLRHLQKLAKNINQGDTPFTLENVEHIKKMAYFMIALIIVPAISSGLVEGLFRSEVNVDISAFNVMEILFMFVLAYIFEYGYEIQLDSKGKMYGQEK